MRIPHQDEASRQALIEARLRERVTSARARSSIPLRRKARWLDWARRSSPAPTPLSTAQKRFWILHQLDPLSTVFSRPLGLKLRGELDRGALEDAINEIVRRHEALRTVFQEHEGEPCQVVLPAVAVPVEFQDLVDFPVEHRDSKLWRTARQEANHTFDLANGPVLRVKLLRSTERDHLLLVLMHHIVFDGWSEALFVREFRELYSAFARRQAPSLAELPIQYGDFAFWQQRRLEEGEIRRQVAYWRSELDGISSSLNLPTDYSRQGALGSVSGVSRLDLPANLTQDLKELSRDERVTLFMTLLAAFQFLLAYHTDQDDIVVGVPAAGRTRVATEKLIGCFMNVLVLRASLRGNPTVRELLAQVRETALRAYANQEAPIEKIVEELRPERRADQWPLFQVMFQLRNLPKLGPPDAFELSVEPFKIDTGGIGGLDLDLEIEETEAGLRCLLRYDTALFRRETADRMLEHYRNVLRAMVHTPEEIVWRLPVLGEAERQRLLVELNDTDAEFPSDVCIHELFERQAEKDPDAIAVELEGHRMTYGELNGRANQLAHHLRALGVGPETLVGICVQRSPEMAVGLLGILKAGAAYVPMDPDYPSERLAFVVEDAQIEVLVTQQSLAREFAGRGTHVLCLDTDWEIGSRASGQNPVTGVSSDNLAYVIYTSGSTGQPKGVMIPHRAACNYLLWKREYFRMRGDDRVLQRASFSFDDSVWEFFESLMAGAAIVMLRPGGQMDSGYIVDLMVREQVTVACFVPSMLRILLEEPRISECMSLRRFETGAEVLPIEVRDRFLEKLSVVLYNGYGPTEASVACTVYPCRPHDEGRTVPIGRPIANTQLYILGSHGQLMPLGASGELCIGGAGLARGYLNRPDATDEKFIPHPFNESPEARIYRTGDRARYFPDGNIEYLGRVDHQVKVRGFRIELEEVEQVMRQHPRVREAAAATQKDQAGDVMLVGYVVPQPGSANTSGELRRFLGERLPDYMVPTIFVERPSLPYLTSGKIDRAALPLPESRQAPLDREIDEPQTETEQVLGRIWREVLGVNSIRRQDDLFALGGHSLSAARVIQGVRKSFRIQISALDVFRYTTLAAMAALIDSTRQGTLGPQTDEERN